MGYQPKQSFSFEINKLNTVTGDISVRADSLRDAEKLLKKLGLLDLVSYKQVITLKQPPIKP